MSTKEFLNAPIQQKYNRIFNFSAGPAVLPVPVIEQIQSELLNYRGNGMSVLEMSHRSTAFENIIQQTEADLRLLAGIPSDYKVIFLQGGASLQFSMLPMNLLPAGSSADYILSGSWSQAALKEAGKVGHVRVAASTEAEDFRRVPSQEEMQLNPEAAYLHFTSNNTIYGTQWSTEPQVADSVPLVCDASSDIFSRPIDITKYGLVYAGTQKNLGIAGATVVIIREDLLERVPPGLPAMLDYRLQAEKESLYNTPPTFSIYACGLVLRWLLELGGLEVMASTNLHKANFIYRVIDNSQGFYRGHADVASRSQMNITYRLPSKELEIKFLKEAAAQGFDGLKGHRSTGGIRASIYNAFPTAGTEALASFMEYFQAENC